MHEHNKPTQGQLLVQQGKVSSIYRTMQYIHSMLEDVATDAEMLEHEGHSPDIRRWARWIQRWASRADAQLLAKHQLVARDERQEELDACPRCGWTMEQMQFADDTAPKPTCPDCGWREGKPIRR